MKISGIILTKNGEVQKAKKSLSFCDEILVFKNAHISDFAQARNNAMKQAKNDWVLFLDSDETVSPFLRDEIINSKLSNYLGFSLRRVDFMWGKELKRGEVGNISLMRLGKKSAGLWKRKVHEYWDIKGRVGELKNPILHYPHQSIYEFINSINKFAELHAIENAREGKTSSLSKIVFWPRAKFFYNLILKRGFLDGIPGFIVALFMSFHSFLAWSELWLKQNRK